MTRGKVDTGILFIPPRSNGKTPEQQIREGMTWEPIEEEKAEARKSTGGNQHMKNFSYAEGGLVRDIIARRVGLGSGKTYEHGKPLRF